MNEKAEKQNEYLGSKLTKRDFISSMGALVALWGFGGSMRAVGAENEVWDVIVVGGGNAGLPAAIFAAERGARVLIVDAGPALGGTLFMTGGMMSAAGTKLQKSKGIVDTPQSHYDDIMRLSRNTADPDIVKLAVFNAADSFDWLTDNGMEVPDEFPIYGPPHHDAYSVARYARGVDKGLSILRVCQQKLQPHIDSGKVAVRLDTEVANLVQDASGRVVGIEARAQDGTRLKFMGRNIALTCGGYTSNSNLVWELEGITDYAYNTYPFSKGAGISLGLQAGGYLKGGDKHLPLFASVLADDNYPSAVAASLRHMPADRKLWEILVNAYGERFVNEDSDTFFAYEDALSKQPDTACWAVFDSAILRDSPPLLSGKQDWTTDTIRKALDEGKPNFYKGATLEELAANAGISKEGLVKTVQQYNDAKKSGKDELGRKNMPRPIAEPPFYAIRAHGTGLISFAGLAVDNELRVIRKDGKPIEGLYAAGELLGAGQLMGRFYCGGMTVTPSLTFGRLLGQKFMRL